jgi:hypothetical protein
VICKAIGKIQITDFSLNDFAKLEGGREVDVYVQVFSGKAEGRRQTFEHLQKLFLRL